MKNPPHPGRIVRQDCIEPLGLTITAAAKALGVTRQALNNLVNGKAGVSPEMAVRLSKAFGKQKVISKFNAIVNRGDRIVLVGRNGVGGLEVMQ